MAIEDRLDINHKVDKVISDAGIGAATSIGGQLAAVALALPLLGKEGITEMLTGTQYLSRNVSPENIERIRRLAKAGNVNMDDINTITAKTPFSIPRAMHKLNRYPSEITPTKHTIAINNNISGMAHEMGHVSGKAADWKNYWRLYGISKKMGVYGTLPASIMSAVLAKKKDEKRGIAENIATYAIPIASIPMMAEEARATIKGLNMIGKAYGAKKALYASPRLAAAYGTYMLTATSPIIANHIARKINAIRSSAHNGANNAITQ